MISLDYILKITRRRDIMRVAYIRVSTVDQNEARQIKAMELYNIEKFFTEKVSAKNTDRAQLKALIDFVREGDEVYIESFSRLARDTRDLLNLIEELQRKGVAVKSLKENLDTSTPTGKLMLTMIGAISTFEREITLERQREGIAIAKQAGKYKGRKEVVKPAVWDEVMAQYNTRKITAVKAMELLGLKKTTFYKLLNNDKNNGE